LACLRKNESPRFTKRIFRGALYLMSFNTVGSLDQNIHFKARNSSHPIS
jgi:hypothetical protein